MPLLSALLDSLKKESGHTEFYSVLGFLVILALPYLKAHNIIPAEWDSNTTTQHLVEAVSQAGMLLFAARQYMRRVLVTYHPVRKAEEAAKVVAAQPVVAEPVATTPTT